MNQEFRRCQENLPCVWIQPFIAHDISPEFHKIEIASPMIHFPAWRRSTTNYVHAPIGRVKVYQHRLFKHVLVLVNPKGHQQFFIVKVGKQNNFATFRASPVHNL
jgi:hypothetical protein